MTARIKLQWRHNPLALGPYILAGRRGITIRVGKAVLCLDWRVR